MGGFAGARTLPPVQKVSRAIIQRKGRDSFAITLAERSVLCVVAECSERARRLIFIYRNRYFILVLLILGTVPLLGSSLRSTYDHIWWQSTPQDERTQFIAGYLDCAVYDLGKTKLAEAQWNVIEPEITTYYASHPESIHRTVPSLILTLGASSGSTDQGPERYPEKHGIFDGDYWRQISPSGRVGFVEGYTACRDSKPGQNLFAAHSAAWYVPQISGTYRLRRDNDIDHSRASKKIATIIQEHTK